MTQETDRPQPQPTPPRPQRGGIPILAIILITVGVVLLLQNLGVLPWELWANLWRLWPVILIAIGISIFLGRSAPVLTALLVVVLIVGAVILAVFMAPRGLTTESFTEALGNLESVDANIDFGAGNLTINALPLDSANLVEAQFKTPGQARATLTRSGDSGRLRINMEGTGFFRGSTDWDISLSRTPKFTIDLNGGAAKMNLDFRYLQVTDISLDTGASEIDIVMPSNAGHVNAQINAGAARVRITIPQEVAARIETQGSALASIDIDTNRFPKTDSIYVSTGFDAAPNRVSMEIRGGAADISVR